MQALNYILWIVWTASEACNNHWSISIRVWRNLGQGDHVIMVTPSISKWFWTTLKSKSVFSDSSSLKSVFVKLRFRDELVWTEGRRNVDGHIEQVYFPKQVLIITRVNIRDLRYFISIYLHFLTSSPGSPGIPKVPTNPVSPWKEDCKVSSHSGSQFARK